MNYLFCLIGPSGTGKDALRKAFQLPYVISYRTRSIREFEIDGMDGHFITNKQFNEMPQNEWIAKTEYNHNQYGITKRCLLPLKYSSMFYIIDQAGVETLKKSFEAMPEFDVKQIVTIYVDSPADQLHKRMHLQGRETEEIEKRMDHYWRHEAGNDFQTDHVLYNAEGRFQETIKKLKMILTQYGV